LSYEGIDYVRSFVADESFKIFTPEKTKKINKNYKTKTKVLINNLRFGTIHFIHFIEKVQENN